MTRETTPEEKEVFEYLNDLRNSGITNMFGAAPYIEQDLAIDKRQARKYLALWMENFNEEGNYDTINV